MKKIILLFVLMFHACSSTSDPEQIKKELIATDIEFSRLSLERGKNFSFSSYIDEKGVLLRPGGMPIKGKQSLDSLQNLRPDSSYTLKWKPLFADAAISGEIGYTYGVWLFSNKDTSFMGSYTTIWKKDKNGKWKFVLDMGNDGLGKDEDKLKAGF